MYPIYKFLLTASGTTRRSYPVYGEGLQKEWTLEGGERFFRERLSGDLTFEGEDYTFIRGYLFGTVFSLTMQISQDAGDSWTDYWAGEFTLADCTVNEDDETITVQPSPVDKYAALLDGIEKEFDIVKLTPAMAKVTLDKRPMLQVYRSGANVIGCWLGGMWWEQDCEAVQDSSELARCGFALCASQNVVMVSGDINPDATGGQTISSAEDTRPPFTITGSNFQLSCTWQHIIDGDDDYGVYTLTLVRPGAGSPRWVREWRENYDSPHILAGRTFQLQPQGGATGVATVGFRIFDVYARILTDDVSYGRYATNPLPANDIAGMAGVYERVIGYEDSNAVIVSTNKTSNPTEYGLFAPGKYYQTPVPAVYGAVAFPMARNSWDEFSMWFVEPAIDIELYGVTQYTIKDAYPLGAVISKLLSQIAPTITFAEDALHSLFFYGAGVSDPYFPYSLFLTPKSNALGSGYDTPAQKGSITLRQVFDMLRDVFRCYWYIDGSALRIEHVKFFDNGLSYSAAGVGADLTTLSVLRTGKTWGWCTSKYKFDKQSLPARYQFAWMDEVTRQFNGQPIDIVSQFVQKDQVEQIQVVQFTSDVDFMRSNPGGCSKDGFALLCGAADVDGYKVPYYTYTENEFAYKLQNGPLSFPYLQRYYLYDLPARNYRIAGQAGTALGVKKPKTQEVIYPAQNDPDPMRLVKTPLGNGAVQKMSVNLSSRKTQVTLKYVAE